MNSSALWPHHFPQLFENKCRTQAGFFLLFSECGLNNLFPLWACFTNLATCLCIISWNRCSSHNAILYPCKHCGSQSKEAVFFTDSCLSCMAYTWVMCAFFSFWVMLVSCTRYCCQIDSLINIFTFQEAVKINVVSWDTITAKFYELHSVHQPVVEKVSFCAEMCRTFSRKGFFLSLTSAFSCDFWEKLMGNCLRTPKNCHYWNVSSVELLSPQSTETHVCVLCIFAHNRACVCVRALTYVSNVHGSSHIKYSKAALLRDVIPSIIIPPKVIPKLKKSTFQNLKK